MDLKIALQVDAENPIAGDLYLHNGTVRLTADLAEEVAQELYIRFRFFKGEWFRDRTIGLPYFQSILGVKTPIGIIGQIFKQVIITCPGVKSLDGFSLKRLPKRGIALDFSCTLADGTVLTSSDFAKFVIGG